MPRTRQVVLGDWDSRAPVPRRRHGLTADEVAYLFSLGCAICGTKDNLEIDHDHRCHRGSEGCRLCVRGALCHNDNKVMWLVRDDPARARRVADYLERSR